MAGGQLLTVEGSGFVELDEWKSTHVSICGVPCAVTDVMTATSLTCVTGEYITEDASQQSHHVLPVAPEQVSASGSSSEQASYNVNNLFDQDVSTSWRYGYHQVLGSVTCATAVFDLLSTRRALEIVGIPAP